MPITLNVSNVDKHVIYDKELQRKLTDFSRIFEQWKIGIRSPVFATVAQKARIEFLDGLTKDHLSILEDHLGDKVYVSGLNYRLTSNFSCFIDDLECFLMDYDSFDDNFSISRDDTSCSVSFWR